MSMNEPGRASRDGGDGSGVPPINAGDLGLDEPVAKWPRVIGVLSTVFGSLGVLANGCGACFYLAGPSILINMMSGIKTQGTPPPGQDPRAVVELMQLLQPWMLVTGVVMVATLATSVWLLIAGIQMLSRKPSSVAMHTWWAFARLALGVLGLLIGVVSTVSTAARQAEISQSYGGTDTATMVMVKALVPAVVVTALVLVYPVVVLVVLRKPWAKSEIARWKSGGEGAVEDLDFK